MVTFLPITPRQAIEGMAVIMVCFVSLSGSNRSRDLVEVRRGEADGFGHAE